VKHVRILIVEDRDDRYEAIMTEIRAPDFGTEPICIEAQHAPDAARACAIVRQQTSRNYLDLILLDYDLDHARPGAPSGETVASAIVEHSRITEAPSVIVHSKNTTAAPRLVEILLTRGPVLWLPLPAVDGQKQYALLGPIIRALLL